MTEPNEIRKRIVASVGDFIDETAFVCGALFGYELACEMLEGNMESESADWLREKLK